MSKQITVAELSAEVLGEMARLSYAESTLVLFRRAFRQLGEYAEEHAGGRFSEATAVDFLNDKFGTSMEDLYSHQPETVYLGNFLRCMRVLLEYSACGAIWRRMPGSLMRAELPPALQEGLDSFDAACRAGGLSESTLRSRGARVKRFLLFLAERGVEDYAALGPAAASEYAVSRAGMHEKSIASDLAAIRCFYRHLHLAGITPTDLAGSIPSPKRYYAPKLPVAWARDDVEALMEGIDRGGPTGKRDYAMLLMVARLGLRASDVRALKMGDICWEAKRIDIVQHKTGVPLSLPLPDDVGWAIIDYLRGGRPAAATCEEVFVRHLAPYGPFESGLSNILARRMREAGIKPGHGRRTVHSLRHALATALLESGAAVDDIARVLGHASARTTGIYLHLDIEGLRACALDPGEVG